MRFSKKKIAFFFSIFATVAFKYFDVFGLSSASEAYSTVLAHNVLANNYPKQSEIDIDVVLIDDYALLTNQQSWPLSYQSYSDLLIASSNHSPDLIFIDILLIDRRNTDDISPLLEALRYISDGGTRIGLADLRVNDASIIRPELIKLSQGDENIFLIDTTNMNILTDPNTLRATGSSLSSILKFYESTCTSTECSELSRKLKEVRGFEIRWAFPPHPENCNTDRYSDEYTNECQLYESSNIWRAVSTFFIGPGDNFQKLRTRIPYHKVHYSDEIVYKGLPHTQNSNPSVVMIGVDLIGINDTISTPLHYELPGVFYYAMALDNLYNLKEAFLRAPKHKLFKFLIETLTIGVLSIFLFMIKSVFHRSQILISSSYILVYAAPPLITYLAFTYLHWPPIDTLGIWGGITLVQISEQPINRILTSLSKGYNFLFNKISVLETS